MNDIKFIIFIANIIIYLFLSCIAFIGEKNKISRGLIILSAFILWFILQEVYFTLFHNSLIISIIFLSLYSLYIYRTRKGAKYFFGFLTIIYLLFSVATYNATGNSRRDMMSMYIGSIYRKYPTQQINKDIFKNDGTLKGHLNYHGMKIISHENNIYIIPKRFALFPFNYIYIFESYRINKAGEVFVKKCLNKNDLFKNDDWEQLNFRR